MQSVNGVQGRGESAVSHRRVQEFIDAMIRENGLSEESKKALQRLASSNRDLAEIGLEELKEVLLDALR